MNEKILEEFDTKFLLPMYEDESLGGNYKAVKSFLSESIAQAIAEESVRMRGKIKSMSLKSENSIDKLPEDSEQNRIANLLNENMVIGYQVALNDLLASLDTNK